MTTLKLTYFKPSGKYYSEGEIEVPDRAPWHAVMSLVRGHAEKRTLPGLMVGHSAFVVHVDYAGESGIPVPHLIVPDAP